ncbi:MAG: hypothetical protein KF847_19670 [Pirellulales bacterium]|nr:hypothetical protein [Pirellulales bacterium]
MAVTIQDLRAAFPDDPAFVVDAAERGLELVDAKAEYADRIMAAAKAEREKAHQAMTAMEARLAAATAEVEALKTRASSAKLQPVPDPTTGVPPAASASDEVEQLTRQYMQSGMPAHEAHQRVMTKFPELRERFVAEANQGNGRRAG